MVKASIAHYSIFPSYFWQFLIFLSWISSGVKMTRATLIASLHGIKKTFWPILHILQDWPCYHCEKKPQYSDIILFNEIEIPTQRSKCFSTACISRRINCKAINGNAFHFFSEILWIETLCSVPIIPFLLVRLITKYPSI